MFYFSYFNFKKTTTETAFAPHVAGSFLFSHFNIRHLLEHGASLLASEGVQYDVDLSVGGEF